MFDRFKKHLDLKATQEPKVTAKPEPKPTEVTKKPQTKTAKKSKKTRKPAKEKTAKTIEDKNPQKPQTHTDLKEVEDPFIGIKEYNSAMQIAEKINKEIASTKSVLGEYLRQLDDVRSVAEKSKMLHAVVAKATGKKQSVEKSEQIDVNGLEIVLDATPLHELTAIESVVRSHQQRLITLQKVKEALEPLGPLNGTEGMRILVLERDGIPEQIMIKLS